MSFSEERDFDVVVFGASGVTGEYVIEELAKHVKGIKWSVAGRNRGKLQEVLKIIGNRIGENLETIEIIEANVHDKETLSKMCKRSKLILNCVGPYRFFGENVIKSCVENGTHHIDVSGEPQFLEEMQLKYFDKAREKGIYIVGSCGFDSIPCDCGVEVVKEKFDGEVNSIETYIQFNFGKKKNTINFGTWQSAIYGLAYASELKPLRQKIKEKFCTKSLPKKNYPLFRRPVLFKSLVVNRWCIPFIGSDRSIVQRTQMYNYEIKNERPVQIQTYMSMPSLLTALATLLMGAIFMLMASFSYGRYLLEKFPELFSFGIFSRTPPKKDSDGSFSITFKADGWSEKFADPSDQHLSSPDKKLTMVLSGPDPGYITTAICMVSAALVVLKEKEKLPEKGGVFTPGVAFRETALMKRLHERGITMALGD